MTSIIWCMMFTVVGIIGVLLKLKTEINPTNFIKIFSKMNSSIWCSDWYIVSLIFGIVINLVTIVVVTVIVYQHWIIAPFVFCLFLMSYLQPFSIKEKIRNWLLDED